ncbi:MAG: Mpo1-like protein [Gammaproteobacteria bacterium]
MSNRFVNFREFYPFYLGEHRNRTCRRLHFVGSCLVLLTIIGVLISHWWWGFILVPVFGYGFAWTGHYFFEKNHPATFKHPFYSLAGDWVMFRDILTGRMRF